MEQIKVIPVLVLGQTIVKPDNIKNLEKPQKQHNLPILLSCCSVLPTETHIKRDYSLVQIIGVFFFFFFFSSIFLIKCWEKIKRLIFGCEISDPESDWLINSGMQKRKLISLVLLRKLLTAAIISITFLALFTGHLHIPSSKDHKFNDKFPTVCLFFFNFRVL